MRMRSRTKTENVAIDATSSVEITQYLDKMRGLSLLFIILLTLVDAADLVILNLKGPSNTASQIGKEVSFMCSAAPYSKDTPRQAYRLKWQHQATNSDEIIDIMAMNVTEQNVVNSSDHNEKFSNMGTYLVIKSILLDDAGIYTCVLDDKSRNSKSAELFVLGETSCDGLNNTFQADEIVTYNCSVKYHGSRPPLLSWEHRSEKLNSSLEINNRTISAKLRLQVNNSMNGIVFHCRVMYKNLFTSTCQASPMRILFPVYIKQVVTDPFGGSKVSKIFKEGDTVSLQCSAYGNPNPEYHWTHINASGNTVALSDLAYYHIDSLKPKNQGNYSCTAINRINGASHSDSMAIVITVIANPTKDDTVISHSTTRRKRPTSTTQSSVKNTNNTVGDVDEGPDHSLSPYAIGALISAGLAVVLILVFIAIAMKVKKRERNVRNKLNRMHDETLDDQEVELLDENIQPRGEDLPVQYGKLRHHWEISRRDIRMIELKAKGSYVEVWKGRMRRFPSRNEIHKLAIKKIIAEATEKERKFFLSEMEVMKMLQSHTNVIQLIGCYTMNEPWLILLEYATEGTLLRYLQSRRPGQQEVEITGQDRQMVRLRNHNISSHRILALTAQIASGLDHITKFKLIYYRLRTSSILVGRGGICKLSGFGFPQDIVERNLYEAASAPVRFMSPECLEKKVFNVKADVWAFGIVIWEILHFGMTPYPAMGPQEVWEKIKSGYRLPQPPHCSDNLYKNVMLQCWHDKPDSRPTYAEALQRLTALAGSPEQHVMFDRLPDYLKSAEMGDADVPT